MKNTKISLKQQMLYTDILLIFIPVFLIGFLAANIIFNTLEKSVEREMGLINDFTTSQVNEYINMPVKLLEKMKDLNFTDASAESHNDMRSYLENTIALYPYFESILLIDQEGDIVNLAPYDTHEIQTSVIHQPYFSEVSNGQQATYWSKLFISQKSTNACVAVVIPMDQLNIVGIIDLKHLNENMLNASAYKNNKRLSVSIVDQFGTYIFDKDMTKVSERKRFEVFDQLKSDNNHSKSTTFLMDGSKVIGYMTALPQTQWYSITLVDEAITYGTMRIVGWVMLGVFVGVIVMTTALSFWSIKKTQSAIDSISRKCIQISKSNYNAMSTETTFVEFEELLSSFNEMARTINEREKEAAEFNTRLEQLVIERTHQLEEINAILEEEITERAAIQEELRQLNETLENKVIERTQKADKANAAKSEFLAIMSHEIRTPINGIIGFLQMLEFSNLNPQQEEYVHHMRASSELLQSIINDILDLSKIEAGKLKIDRMPFQLAETLESVIKPFEILIKAKSQIFDISIDPKLATVCIGDPIKIKQIISNLMSNAYKFTDLGRISFHGKCVEEDSDNLFLEIKVSDTGLGMNEEMKNNLFKPFVQGDTSITRKYGGTGLGLKISKEMIQLMDGTIDVESHEGFGTTFIVKLPLEKSTQQITKATPTLPEYSFKKDIQILLVEDNFVNQKVFANLLKLKNIECYIVNNGQEALDQLAIKQYDIVFMDCQMPVMDGFEATQAIRKREMVGEHVPIIALSAYAMAEDVERCIQSGMDEHIAKPVEINQIFRVIQKYVWNKSIPSANSPDLEYFVKIKNALMDATGFDEASSQAIVEAFYSQGKELIGNAMVSLNQDNFAQSKKWIHQLKGAAATVRALDISQKVLQIEQDIGIKSKEEIQGAMVAIQEILTR